ncbi:MAG: septum formation initiator family protein [candidate division Zixibacteria bacterium]|nr:septum formation initiator family protein [candidate division Zixibacteria bacterium]
MTRRIRKSRSLIGSMADGLRHRLSDHNSLFRQRVIRIGFWVIGLLFLYSLMFGTYRIPRIIQLEMERKSLIDANRHLTIDLIEDDRLRQLLISNSEYIENIARTKYHMVRPNETIYRYHGK